MLLLCSGPIKEAHQNKKKKTKKKESKVKDREDVRFPFSSGVPASPVFDDSSSLMKGTRHKPLMNGPSFGRSERLKRRRGGTEPNDREDVVVVDIYIKQCV